MLREIKNEYSHYFMDEFGRIQGEYKSWYVNGVLRGHWYYVDDIRHGEAKAWYKNGVLWDHRYYVDGRIHGEYKSWYDNGVLRDHRYYVNHVRVHDFIASPLTDIEKMLLALKYGAPMLPVAAIQ